MSVRITVVLTTEQAAPLARLCEKFVTRDGKSYLYPHVPAEVQREQRYQMVQATAAIYEALRESCVSTWPWIDTGVVS